MFSLNLGNILMQKQNVDLGPNRHSCQEIWGKTSEEGPLIRNNTRDAVVVGRVYLKISSSAKVVSTKYSRYS